MEEDLKSCIEYLRDGTLVNHQNLKSSVAMMSMRNMLMKHVAQGEVMAICSAYVVEVKRGKKGKKTDADREWCQTIIDVLEAGLRGEFFDVVLPEGKQRDVDAYEGILKRYL